MKRVPLKKGSLCRIIFLSSVSLIEAWRVHNAVIGKWPLLRITRKHINCSEIARDQMHRNNRISRGEGFFGRTKEPTFVMNTKNPPVTQPQGRSIGILQQSRTSSDLQLKMSVRKCWISNLASKRCSCL